MKWNPIETAPKDGTHILGFACSPDGQYRKDGEIVQVHWRERYGMNSGSKGVKHEDWHDTSGNLKYLSHWMPMPLPPYPEE